MHTRRVLLRAVFGLLVAAAPLQAADQRPFRIGVIGLGTSHAVAFTRALHAEDPPPALRRLQVVAAFPQGSWDIESSVVRIPNNTEAMRSLGVEIVGSIDQLVEMVDGVLLETNDGRPHLEQALPVLRAGKPIFIDKPLAASLSDVLALYQLAEHYGAPIFSSSALRYSPQTVAIRNGKLGRVLGADTFSPASLEPSHPDFYWYGIHGVEPLFAALGIGCRSVTRTHSAQADIAVGTWSDGRLGTFRGLREGHRGYGGVAYGSDDRAALGDFCRI